VAWLRPWRYLLRPKLKAGGGRLWPRAQTLALLKRAALIGALGVEHLEPAFAFARVLAVAVIDGVLQAPLPAQRFTPKQRPLKFSALAVATSAPETISAAAVMTILAPIFCMRFVFLSSRMSLIGRGIDVGKATQDSYSRE
jgi:hypothetical protein